MSAPESVKPSISPRGLILVLLGVAMVAVALLWWKSQSADRARERLRSEYGASVEPESRENGGGWSVILDHETLRDFSEIAALIERAGPVRFLDLTGCQSLASLKGMSSIQALDTLIAADCPQLEGVEGVEALPHLRVLAVSDNAMLASLEGLRNLPRLEILDASRCPKLAGFSARGLPALRDLSLVDCPALESVDVNGSQTLVSLMLDNAGALKTLAGLENAVGLTDLIVSGCHALQSLDALDKLAALIKLDARNTPAVAGKLSDIGRLPSLEILLLGGLPDLVDLKPLSGLSHLSEMHIEACESLASLRGFPASLTGYAGITHCPALTTLEGIEVAAGLERLDLTGNAKLVSLEPLAGLAELRELNLAGCRGISDTAVFAQMPQLGIVQLGGSGVAAGALAELRKTHPETIFDFNAP